MMKKLFLVQKLQRKIKQSEDIHEALGPMIKIIKEEKNKLMIQRLEIESELRNLGRDPQVIVDAIEGGTAPYDAPGLEQDKDEEEMEEDASDLYMDSMSNEKAAMTPSKSAASLDNSLASLVVEIEKANLGEYQGDLSLDIPSNSKSRQEEEEEIEDDDDEYESAFGDLAIADSDEFISADDDEIEDLVDSAGVYIEEFNNDQGILGSNQEELKAVLESASVRGRFCKDE